MFCEPVSSFQGRKSAETSRNHQVVHLLNSNTFTVLKDGYRLQVSNDALPWASYVRIGTSPRVSILVLRSWMCVCARTSCCVPSYLSESLSHGTGVLFRDKLPVCLIVFSWLHKLNLVVVTGFKGPTHNLSLALNICTELNCILWFKQITIARSNHDTL